MIKFIPHFMKVRNGKDGEFIDNLAIKGAPGDIDNLGSFATNDIPENLDEASEKIVLTQKGATLLRQMLVGGDIVVSDADNASSALKAYKDHKGNIIHNTYATKANLNDDLAELQHLLEGGDIVVGDANWAQRAFEDENGYNIAHTYATDSNARQYVSSLKQMLVDGQLIVGEAARAMLDDRGNTITDTYATKSALEGLQDSLEQGGQIIVAESTKATQDGKGKVIADTYATKELAQQYVTDLQQMLEDGGVIVLGADSAEQARQAEHALCDGNGNNIVNTYATKSDVERDIDGLGRSINDGGITAAHAVLANYVQFDLNISLNNTYPSSVPVYYLYYSKGIRQIKQTTIEAKSSNTLLISDIDAGSILVFANNSEYWSNFPGCMPGIERSEDSVTHYTSSTPLESHQYKCGFTIMGGGYGNLIISGK